MKKTITVSCITMILILAMMLGMTGCVEGTVLSTGDVFSSIIVSYWEKVNDDSSVDVDKPVVGNEDISSVIYGEALPLRMYSYISLKWNHLISDEYRFTIITFSVTTDTDIDFEFSLMGSAGSDLSGETISQHVISCRKNIPSNIALALNNMTSTGPLSERLSIVNFVPEQRKVKWRISNVQIGGVELSVEEQL